MPSGFQVQYTVPVPMDYAKIVTSYKSFLRSLSRLS
jgi:hypothetical protein